MKCGSSRFGCWAIYLGTKKGSKRNVELMRIFMICMFGQILHLLGWWNCGGWDTQRKWHLWTKREMYTECWWGNQKYRNHLKILGLNWRIILNQSLKLVWDRMDWIHLAQDMEMDEILQTRWGNYGFSRNPEVKRYPANLETISFPKNTLLHGLRSRMIYYFSCTTWKPAEYDYLYVLHYIKHLKIVASVYDEDMAVSILRNIRQIH